MEKTHHKTDHIKPFDVRAKELVAEIVSLLKVPGSRAALRRAVGVPPGDRRYWDAHEYVMPFIVRPEDIDDPSAVYRLADDEAAQRALYGVATLIAAQPRTGRDEQITQPKETEGTEGEAPVGRLRRYNLGRSLASAAGRRILSRETIDNRLRLLCRQNLDGIHRQLAPLTQHLRSNKIPIDWLQLCLDLARWERDRPGVAREWLQDYYRVLYQVEAAEKKASEKRETDATPESEK